MGILCPTHLKCIIVPILNLHQIQIKYSNNKHAMILQNITSLPVIGMQLEDYS